MPYVLAGAARHHLVDDSRTSSSAVRLTSDLQLDTDPYISPVGDRLSWIHFSSNMVSSANHIQTFDGSSLTGDVRVLSGSYDVVSLLRWSPDGEEAFTHAKSGLGRFREVRVELDVDVLVDITPEGHYEVLHEDR